MKRKLLSWLLALTMCFSLTACGGGDESLDASNNTPVDMNRSPAAQEAGDGSWAVYWYLCGSDLETNGGLPPSTCRKCWKYSSLRM